MARPFARGRKTEPDRTEDAFVDRIWEAFLWAQRNARTAVVGLVVLGLLLAGVYYYLSYRSTVREQAAVEFQVLLAQLATQEPAVVAERLHSFVVRFDGTPTAEEARLTLGRVQLDLDRPAAALETLRPVAGRPADTPLGHSARILSARAHEAQGDLEAALEVLARLGERAALPFQRRAALADRARLLLQAGRLEEAATAYENLVRETEEANRPPEAARYRLRLGEVRALLAAGAPSPGPGG